MTRYAVRTATSADAAGISRLMAERADLLESRDPRLRLPRSPATVRPGLVAVDPAGAVRAHVVPVASEVAEDDEMLAFAAPRSTTWRDLAFADGEALHAVAVAARRTGTADDVLWPTADDAAPFVAAGLGALFAYALRPPGPLAPGPAAVVRRAEPADTDILTALHVEEIAFHEAHGGHIRVVPGLEPAFRARLARLWSGDRPEDGASLLHVLEIDGEVAGMCESMLTVVPDDGTARPLCPGRYGYLNSVSVTAAHRGRGWGRTLTTAVLDTFAAYDVAGCTLWFSHANPVASRFWPRLGFRPLWTSYERRE